MDDAVIEVFRRAARDRVHGASEIEQSLLADLLVLSSSWTEQRLAAGARILMEGQPAMAPLMGLADRILRCRPDELAAWIEERKAAIVRMPEALATNAMPWIEPAARVVTISRSSAVAAVIEGAWKRGWHGSAVVLDGSSAGGGAEQAEVLAGHGPARSQPDAAALQWLDLDGTVVVVGADAVGGDRFVNCVGTGALVELASAREVPVIVVADSGKDVPETKFAKIVASLQKCREDEGREYHLFEAISMAFVSARVSD